MFLKCFVAVFVLFSLTACTTSSIAPTQANELVSIPEESTMDLEPETESMELLTDPQDKAIVNTIPERIDKPTFIEQEFIDLLIESLHNNTEYEVLKDITSDKLLTKEEVEEIDLGDSKEFIIQLLGEDSRYSSYHEVMQVDADNDGVDDIIFYWHSGGSAGFVSLEFYKGLGGGVYEHSYSSGFGVYTENAFVKYNDRNYFLLTSVDYNRKVRTGFDLFCFIDGALVEHASIQKLPESYTPSSKTVSSVQYEAISNEIADKAQDIYFKGEIYTGSGEAKLNSVEEQELNEFRKNLRNSSILTMSSWYTADIDNDGIDEIYSKGMWWPSNNSTFLHLTYDFFKESQAYDIQTEWGVDFWEGGRIPINLWVERYNGENIVCVLSAKQYDSDNANAKDEFVIDCYYVFDNVCKSVIQIEFSPDYKTTVDIYTQGVNKDFINQGASDIGKG